jgi:hypothetical protein
MIQRKDLIDIFVPVTDEVVNLIEKQAYNIEITGEAIGEIRRVKVRPRRTYMISTQTNSKSKVCLSIWRFWRIKVFTTRSRQVLPE